MSRSTTIIICAAAVALAGCTRPELERPSTAIPVAVEAVARKPFTPSVALTGVVRASETIPLVAPYTGTLVYPPRFVTGLRTGETVRAGEVVAVVRNDQVRSSMMQARYQMEAADDDFARQQRSYQQGVASAAEFSAYRKRAQQAREAYELATKEVSRLSVVAPRSGTLVVDRQWANGATIDAGARLAEITIPGAPRVESSVAAADRERLRPGLRVELRHGDWRGSGQITEVASVIDASGTVRVVMSVDPGTATPPPGSGVDITVQLEARPEAITVPEDAIVAAADGAAVFVVTTSDNMGGLHVKRERVELGGRAGGRVEIMKGLRDADRVVVTGADELTDDSIVTVASEGAKS